MRPLGVVREFDVLGAAVAVAGRRANPLDESPRATSHASRALPYVAARLRERRAEAFDATIKDRLPAELRRIARRLARVEADLAQSSRHETRHWQWVVQARVVNRATRLRQALEHAGPVYGLRPLHEVRIAVKKLRYALELARAVSETTQASDLRRLRTAQNQLGQLRDTQSLVAATRETQATLTKEAIWVSTELDGFVSEWEDQCRVLHARYLKGVPELLALCDRLAAATDENRSPRRRAVTLRRVASR
jgi:CHAD domain-containing protein